MEYYDRLGTPSLALSGDRPDLSRLQRLLPSGPDGWDILDMLTKWPTSIAIQPRIRQPDWDQGTLLVAGHLTTDEDAWIGDRPAVLVLDAGGGHVHVDLGDYDGQCPPLGDHGWFIVNVEDGDVPWCSVPEVRVPRLAGDLAYAEANPEALRIPDYGFDQLTNFVISRTNMALAKRVKISDESTESTGPDDFFREDLYEAHRASRAPGRARAFAGCRSHCSAWTTGSWSRNSRGWRVSRINRTPKSRALAPLGADVEIPSTTRVGVGTGRTPRDPELRGVMGVAGGGDAAYGPDHPCLDSKNHFHRLFPASKRRWRRSARTGRDNSSV